MHDSFSPKYVYNKTTVKLNEKAYSPVSTKSFDQMIHVVQNINEIQNIPLLKYYIGT